MAQKRTVVIGLLGPVLDTGRGPERWERWRPTVSLCQHEHFVVDRFELLYNKTYENLRKVVAADIVAVSPETDVRCTEVGYINPWDFEDVYGALMDFARGQKFKPDEEDYFVHITTGSHVAQICLFLLTEARYLPGRLIQSVPPRKGTMAAGTFDVVDLDLSRYDKLATRFSAEARQSESVLKGGIATRNARFNALIEQIEQVVVGSRAPVLLMGPTGAGKSQLARRVFELKKLRHKLVGQLMEVNCATIRGDGAMSSLFGHVRGAFTGAAGERAGLLKGADGGMLFLDEIGELGLEEQAMLLRAVEEKRFMPVGSDKAVGSDFQLIAGTNRDLAAAVRRGEFREDLLARINLWTFQLPALRERVEDIEPNLEYELEEFARKNGRKVTINREARDAFLEFATSGPAEWAGNFRDLNAAVTRMCTLAPGGRISTAVVEGEIERLRRQWGGGDEQAGSAELERVLPAGLELDLFDRVQLSEVVKVCRRSKTLSEAGRELFAVSRGKKGSANDADRLRKYLARFGLEWAKL